MREKLQNILNEALDAINSGADLEQIRIKYLEICRISCFKSCDL